MLLTVDEQKAKYNLIADGLKMTGLKKVRSRMIAEALLRGESVRGNTLISLSYHFIIFYYRNTIICSYDIGRKLYSNSITDYENSASTKNQRELARQAIFEVFCVECAEPNKGGL